MTVSRAPGGGNPPRVRFGEPVLAGQASCRRRADYIGVSFLLRPPPIASSRSARPTAGNRRWRGSGSGAALWDRRCRPGRCRYRRHWTCYHRLVRGNRRGICVEQTVEPRRRSAEQQIPQLQRSWHECQSDDRQCQCEPPLPNRPRSPFKAVPSLAARRLALRRADCKVAVPCYQRPLAPPPEDRPPPKPPPSPPREERPALPMGSSFSS